MAPGIGPVALQPATVAASEFSMPLNAGPTGVSSLLCNHYTTFNNGRQFQLVHIKYRMILDGTHTKYNKCSRDRRDASKKREKFILGKK